MLVHKRSMGVLPLHSPEDVPDFIPDEWWEVKGNTTIGRRLLRTYPFCDPVVDGNGELLDIVPWPNWKIYGEPEPEPDRPAVKSKQRRRRKLL